MNSILPSNSRWLNHPLVTVNESQGFHDIHWNPLPWSVNHPDPITGPLAQRHDVKKPATAPNDKYIIYIYYIIYYIYYIIYILYYIYINYIIYILYYVYMDLQSNFSA